MHGARATGHGTQHRCNDAQCRFDRRHARVSLCEDDCARSPDIVTYVGLLLFHGVEAAFADSGCGCLRAFLLPQFLFESSEFLQGDLFLFVQDLVNAFDFLDLLMLVGGIASTRNDSRSASTSTRCRSST